MTNSKTTPTSPAHEYGMKLAERAILFLIAVGAILTAVHLTTFAFGYGALVGVLVIAWAVAGWRELRRLQA